MVGRLKSTGRRKHFNKIEDRKWHKIKSSLYLRWLAKLICVETYTRGVVSSTKHNLSNIKHIIAVAAGKGGVGKSTLTLSLALYFQKNGYRVGLMDADLYGPSLKKMLPEEIPLAKNAEMHHRIIPAESRGIKLMSMAYFSNAEDPTVVRAPIANGIIKQFIHFVDWGELDFLFIDFPPGTGDIQLTLIQEGSLSGAVIITTPQQIATLDASKSIAMFRQMQVPLIGLVENMSYYALQGSQSQIFYPFGQGGGERLAFESDLFFLGKIPIEEQICCCCDQGRSLFEEAADTLGAIAIISVAKKIHEQLEAFGLLKSNDLKSFDLQWQ
jgi:ATP-binding protein involved in chromosome partitioning